MPTKDNQGISPQVLSATSKREEYLKQKERESQEIWENTIKELNQNLPTVIQNTRQGWREQSGIASKFYDKTFKNFDSKKQSMAYKLVISHDWLRKENQSANSIMLYSPDSYGVGKTHLLCAMANQVIDAWESAVITTQNYPQIHKINCPVYYITETDLISRIRATFNRVEVTASSETEESIYAKISRVAVLILDDIGKVKPRDLNFVQSVYYRIIDDRYTKEKPMALATNLDLNQLEEHIGGACADRIREMCGKNNMIKLVGESYRKNG